MLARVHNLKCPFSNFNSSCAGCANFKISATAALLSSSIRWRCAYSLTSRPTVTSPNALQEYQVFNNKTNQVVFPFWNASICQLRRNWVIQIHAEQSIPTRAFGGTLLLIVKGVWDQISYNPNSPSNPARFPYIACASYMAPADTPGFSDSWLQCPGPACKNQRLSWDCMREITA